MEKLHEKPHPLKAYNHKPVCARTYQWLARHGVRVDEIPSSAADALLDAACGAESCIPRATAMLVKLRIESPSVDGTVRKFVLVLLPAHQRVNLTAVRKAFGGTSAFVSPPSEVDQWCKAVPGCIPPIVRHLGLPLVIDSRLASHPEIYAASGRPGFVVRYAMRDLITSEGATFIELSQKPALSRTAAIAAAAATKAFKPASSAARELEG